MGNFFKSADISHCKNLNNDIICYGQLCNYVSTMTKEETMYIAHHNIGVIDKIAL